MAPYSKEASMTSSTTGGNSTLTTRIIMLGDHGVGKTAFLASIVKNDDAEQMTKKKHRNLFLASGYTKRMKYGDRNVDVVIQDTAGQERFRSLTSSYYRRANGCLLFFNAHNESSFDNLSLWLDDIKRYCPDENPVIVLVGITNCLYKTGDLVSSSIESNKNRNQRKKDISVISSHGSDTTADYCTSDRRHPVRESVAVYSTRHLSLLSQQSLIDEMSGYHHSSHCSLNQRRTTSLTNSSNDIDQYNDRKKEIKSEKAPAKSKTMRPRKCSSLTETNRRPPVEMSFCQFCKHTQSYYQSREEDNTGDENNTDSRVISDEQAQNFAYAHGIPYREIDLASDYSSIEMTLNTVVDSTFRGNRLCSVLLESTGNASSKVVLIKPSAKYQSRCSCK